MSGASRGRRRPAAGGATSLRPPSPRTKRITEGRLSTRTFGATWAKVNVTIALADNAIQVAKPMEVKDR